jgi:hypothetical protein
VFFGAELHAEKARNGVNGRHLVSAATDAFLRISGGELDVLLEEHIDTMLVTSLYFLPLVENDPRVHALQRGH